MSVPPCPACGGELSPVLPHCKRRAGRCGWVKHTECGATVDPVRGTFSPGPKPDPRA